MVSGAQLRFSKAYAVGLFLAMSAVAAPVSAHHSFAMFDRGRSESVDGTVKDFEMINPHGWLRLMVLDAHGRTNEWSMETGGPQQLQRAGLTKDQLKPGDKVSVAIHPLRDGSFGGQLASVTLADGRTLELDRR